MVEKNELQNLRDLYGALDTALGACIDVPCYLPGCDSVSDVLSNLMGLVQLGLDKAGGNDVC